MLQEMSTEITVFGWIRYSFEKKHAGTKNMHAGWVSSIILNRKNAICMTHIHINV